ncbi:P-loop containing nucleoside triphosphate hydrolase protein [Tirmania nivea]|nr:P-loop containing nucleoside triphosphate hydrolase protein [Tirmania nivea]
MTATRMWLTAALTAALTPADGTNQKKASNPETGSKTNKTPDRPTSGSSKNEETDTKPLQQTIRIQKSFLATLSGNGSVTGSAEAKLFLKGLCLQPNPVACIEKIRSSPRGLDILQSALFVDVTPDFINGYAAQFLIYIQDEKLRYITGGRFLDEVALAVVDPPLFWHALTALVMTGCAPNKTLRGFAGLLLRCIELPTSNRVDRYRKLARNENLQRMFADSEDAAVRDLGGRIDHILGTIINPDIVERVAGTGPGGRHDNDFENFREVRVLASVGELSCAEPPFLRGWREVMDENERGNRAMGWLDQQFRLLREDLLGEMRKEVEYAVSKAKETGGGKGMLVEGWEWEAKGDGIDCGAANKQEPWAVRIRLTKGLPNLERLQGAEKLQERKQYVETHPSFLKHGSVACVTVDEEVVALVTVRRDNGLLVQEPPILVLQFPPGADSNNCVRRMHKGKDWKLILLETPLYAYEHILRRLQLMTKIPLEEELLFWSLEMEKAVEEKERNPTYTLQELKMIEKLKVNLAQGNCIKEVLNWEGSKKKIVLDKRQGDAVLGALTRRVGLIQGPPGTGKSFLGALITKFLIEYSTKKVLVVCYTNHALDQFLSLLLDFGIPSCSIVRLGGKSIPKTKALTLANQPNTAKFGRDYWSYISNLRQEMNSLEKEIKAVWEDYLRSKYPTNEEIVNLLEVLDGSKFHMAFKVPRDKEGMRVGRKKGLMGKFYLLDQWRNGRDAGILRDKILESCREVWEMSLDERKKIWELWKEQIWRDKAEHLCRLGESFNQKQKLLDEMFMEKDVQIMRGKRIIACTTTAAAKYAEQIQKAGVDVLMVEEAGEILEAHVLAALGSKTGQLIMIGDHKQLRPKIANYRLSVEKGEGWDLNRSLFERLVSQGYPCVGLVKQYRMREEIGDLVKGLTYPDLEHTDGPRPDLLGLKGNVIWINHNIKEEEVGNVAESKEGKGASSKKNLWEVEMVKKIVWFLVQQGYKSKNMVVLTPYVAQLGELRRAMGERAVVNELDVGNLVREGYITSEGAKPNRREVQLATIDNYQGEEKDIVIASLVRSNNRGDIGFMTQQQRLNVLLSRARNGLILIGSEETFRNSPSGGELWMKFFDLMKGRIYDGLPVICNRHPQFTKVLKTPADFDIECPDGGCDLPCPYYLKCAQHRCPLKCHPEPGASGHKDLDCHYLKTSTCYRNHISYYPCYKGYPQFCRSCVDEDEAKRKQSESDKLHQDEMIEIQRKHDLREVDCNLQIKKLNDQMEREKLTEMLRQNLKELEEDLKSMNKAKRNSQGDALNALNTCEPREAAPIPKYISPAKEEWQRQKSVDSAYNRHIDQIMEMVGLENVKEHVLRIKAKVDISKRQRTSLRNERFNIAFLGNPGTGKTTVAKHYVEILAKERVIPYPTIKEITGALLTHGGIDGAQKCIDELRNKGGGALFIDEAYQLTRKNSAGTGGSPVLDFLLGEMEKFIGEIVVIVAGYRREMEEFFEHNPGLNSRFPYSLTLRDYTNEELEWILRGLVQEKYMGKMKMEGGITGLYIRILIRRIGRGRGKDGFSNARAVQNAFAIITERQANRVASERKEGGMPDDFWFSKEDLIGPDPSKAVMDSAAWKELQELIGLENVKGTVRGLIDRIETNYLRELRELAPVEVSLNRVFLGSPGTGKTSVAKLYGQILKDLGALSNGEVLVKNPADFIGAVIGESEKNTKGILQAAMGKVLIIDEAYMLYSSSSSSGDKSGENGDIFRTAVIDTLVAEVQNVPGEDRCVLLLGYEDQMTNMFQSVNPGFARRFPLDQAFKFEDFSIEQLDSILDLKLKKAHLGVTERGKKVAVEVLERARMTPNFGNAGEVENLLTAAKERYLRRMRTMPVQERPGEIILEESDFDPEFDRATRAEESLEKLFEGVVGCEDIIQKLRGYQKTAQACKARGRDPREVVPTNFVFKGPPGTGKTTTARKVGRVFMDMGFLSSDEVVECSATDLVGRYVGWTGPKTRKKVESALGKVLFIDEAYRLGEGSFSTEVVNELVDIITKPKFMGKVVVILAGYEEDINKLFGKNDGLSSRFSEEISFRPMGAEDSLRLLMKELEKGDVVLRGTKEAGEGYKEMVGVMECLVTLKGWGNARDVLGLAKSVVGGVLRGDVGWQDGTTLFVREEEVRGFMEAMLRERKARETKVPKPDLEKAVEDMWNRRYMEPEFEAPPPPPPPPRTATATATKCSTPPPPPEELPPNDGGEDVGGDGRDPGVSDEIWRQLQRDKEKAKLRGVNVEEERARKRLKEMGVCVAQFEWVKQKGGEWMEVEWDRVEWDGVEWMKWSGVDEVEWSGMKWSGMEWSGMKWSGMKWSGMLNGYS